MSDIPNGFTGFSRKDPHFVSAGEALRRSRYDDTSFVQRKQERASKQDTSLDMWRVATSSSDRDRARSEVGRGYSERPAILDFVDDAGKPEASFNPDKLADIPDIDRRWAWIEINLNAIRHNVSAVKHMLAPGTCLMAVVKADAYGHGAVQCAKTALNAGAEYLAVATVDEAIALREAYVNAPVLVLAEPPATAIPLLLAYKITPTIFTSEFAIKYAEAADVLGLRAPYHLKVNTGMNRIGVRWDEVVPFMRQISFHRALALEGTFTHFATADCPGTIDFDKQAARFADAIAALREAGIDPGMVHAANSAALIRYPKIHLDMVRLGIALYGFYPCSEAYPLIELEPAMSVKARIAEVKSVPFNEGVSYGLHYLSPGSSARICTLPLGYADGYRRGLSGRIDVILGGKRCHQVGNICMDQCMFEVDFRQRNHPDPQIGDVVTIVGADGDAVVSIDEMAETLDTIQHEVAIGFGCSRLPRIYV